MGKRGYLLNAVCWIRWIGNLEICRKVTLKVMLGYLKRGSTPGAARAGSSCYCVLLP